MYIYPLSEGYREYVHISFVQGIQGFYNKNRLTSYSIFLKHKTETLIFYSLTLNLDTDNVKVFSDIVTVDSETSTLINDGLEHHTRHT